MTEPRGPSEYKKQSKPFQKKGQAQYWWEESQSRSEEKIQRSMSDPKPRARNSKPNKTRTRACNWTQ